MKSKIASLVAIFELISIVFSIEITNPSAFADTTPSPGPSSNPHPISASCDKACTCKTGCDASQKFLDAIDAGTSCCGDIKGKDDSYLATHNITCDAVLYDGTEGHKFSDCRITQAGKLGELPHHCNAKSLDEQARDYDLGMATAWTAVTATCLVACGLSATPAYFAAAATCAGLDTGATIADMGLTIQLNIDAKKKVLNLKADQASNYGSLISGVGLATSLGVAAATTSAKASGAAVACVNAAFSTVVMALKWDNYVKNKDNADAECAVVNTLGWPSDVRPTPRPETAPPQSGKSGGGPNKFGGGTTGIVNAEDGSNAMISDMTANFPGSNFGAAAASSGPLGQIIDAFPNKKDFPKVLEKMGVNLGALKEKLATTNPAETIGSMLSLPAEAQALLSNVNQLAANGEIQINGDASIMQGGGGKGGAGSGSSGDAGFNPMAFFAPKAASATGGANAVNFSAKISSAASDSTDIWHSGIKGSIFEIVSHKLEKTGERIEQLEWATPLNRALNGLPRTLPGSAKSVTDSPKK